MLKEKNNNLKVNIIMKQLKRKLMMTLVALIAVTTQAWAQTQTPLTIDWDATNKQASIAGMPAGNVTVSVEYWPGMLTLPAASEKGTVAVEGLINNKIMDENFDDYTAGGKLAQTANAAGNSYWTTWSNTPGGDDDGMLTTLNENTCLKVNGSTDQVLQLGDQTSGMWEYSLDVYVPDGNIGYFNLLHNFGGTNIWVFDCYLNGTYNGSTYSYAPGHGTVNAGTKMKADLPCVHDEWMHVSIVIDIDNDLAKLYFNGLFICEWQWSLNVYAGSVYGGKLAASDFYGVSGDFYVDNITFTQISALPAGFEKDDDGNIYIESGTQFTLVSTPAENYHLASLSDGTNTYDVDDDGKVTITMPDDNLTLTAEFAENTYTVEFAEGIDDADKWSAEPNTGLTKGETVTVTYSGSKKVIGVKAEKKVATITITGAGHSTTLKINGCTTWADVVALNPEVLSISPSKAIQSNEHELNKGNSTVHAGDTFYPKATDYKWVAD